MQMCVSQFQQEKKENSELLEQSLLQSQLMMQNSVGNMSTYYEEGMESSAYSEECDGEDEESKNSSVTSV
jgi:hypothetical protein